VNFITYLEPPYLLDYNYIVIPLPTGFFVSAYLNGEGVQEFLTKDTFQIENHIKKFTPASFVFMCGGYLRPPRANFGPLFSLAISCIIQRIFSFPAPCNLAKGD
jgi:hypothetical protein